MQGEQQVEDLAAQAADAVRRVLSQAEERAAEIVRDAEAKAASLQQQAETDAAAMRERAESDARGQIEAAKRALDELGGTLAAAASSALPKAENESRPTETELEQRPAQEPEVEKATAGGGNGDDAAERLVAMKLAVDGKNSAEIEAELVEKFGPRDRSDLLKDVLSRVPR